MSPLKRAAIASLFAVIGAAVGFWCGRANAPARIEREVETIEQVRTVFVRERVEATRESEATERIVERRILAPCPVCMPGEEKTSENGQLEAFPGRVLIEERVIERAIAQSERLQFDATAASREDLLVHSEAERIEARELPRWSLNALVGWSWSDATPVYGLALGVRVVGPLELGVWGTSSAAFRGAAGVSAGIRW